MRVAIVDYGMGNLGSVRRALLELGAAVVVADKPELLATADSIVLPGVGSFTDGMENLTLGGWVEAIHSQVVIGQKPFLGICLGMQLLATSGTEGGGASGLGLIPGKVERLDVLGCTQRIPHVGWNSLICDRAHPMLSGIPDGTDFYFVHSFAFQAEEVNDTLAITEYDIPITAAIGKDNIWGAQFHPEKSSKAGFRVLKNFLGNV